MWFELITNWDRWKLLLTKTYLLICTYSILIFHEFWSHDFLFHRYIQLLPTCTSLDKWHPPHDCTTERLCDNTAWQCVQGRGDVWQGKDGKRIKRKTGLKVYTTDTCSHVHFPWERSWQIFTYSECRRKLVG